jgi:glycosyltransferase involved in cell wall biosynthesis
MPSIALLADFPVHALPGYEDREKGHHATWLPPLAMQLEVNSPGFTFHWITCSKEVSEPTTLRAWNQTFHLLPRGKLSIEMLTGFRGERRRIGSLLRSLKPDLVHGWGTEQGYGDAAMDYPRENLLSLQGILGSYCKAAPMPWLTRVQAHHEARVLKQAHHLTVESPWGRARLLEAAPHAQIHLLEYGAHPACFEVVRKPATKPLALFVGSLSILKGVDTLLDAFSDPRLGGVDLLLVGAGSSEFQRRKLSANIQFLGHRTPAEVRDWMAKAWCLVHPTRADTSPNCVKEARVIGLPVVTTPDGGQTQYVEHGKSGFIHPAGDVEGLIEGVLALTRDLETNLAAAAHGRTANRAALTPEKTMTRLLEIYRSIMDS